MKKGSFHILILALSDNRLNRIFSSYEYVTPIELALADHCTTSDLENMNRSDNAKGYAGRYGY